MNTNFLCEQKLKEESPELHSLFTNSVLWLQHMLTKYENIFPTYTDHTALHSMEVMAFSRDIANRIFYMDEGIVYEEGTPEQIFNNPQREKTKAFVKRLRAMEYKINSVDFDLYSLNARVDEFGRKHYLQLKRIKNIELVIEELIVNNIIHHTAEISVQVGYYEVDSTIEISLFYGGTSYNPFNSEDEDALSMLLVRQMTGGVQHKYDGKNRLVIEIKSE